MDEIDLRLIQILKNDPRASFREIAEELDIPIQAAHRRLQNLLEQKIILGFAANISIRYVRAVKVFMIGRFYRGSKEEIAEALKENETISDLLFGSQATLYVSCVLRNISDLEGTIDFVKKNATLTELQVGIEPMQYDIVKPKGSKSPPALSQLDRKIIASLFLDCRKPIADIANELKVTASTVNQRLDKLIEEGALEFTLILHHGHMGDTVALLKIFLNEGAEKGKAMMDIERKHGIKVDDFKTFDNIPDMIMCNSWTKSKRDLEMLIEEIQSEPFMKSVVPDIIIAGRHFPTWRERMSAFP